MNNVLVLLLVIVPIFSFSKKSFTNNQLIKTAKMLEIRGDVEGAISIYEDILSKEQDHWQTVENLKDLYLKN